MKNEKRESMQVQCQKVALLKAVAYYRMSSDDQKTSIAQQRIEVRALAARLGYEIVREYEELGKSGSRNQGERTEFKRMLEDSGAGDFQVVLCYDSSRFARLDSIDGAVAKQLLRANGVHLETVKEGWIDWNSFAGRLLDTVLSEANHKFSLDLSRESLRGRLDRLRNGFWPHGAVPYGFDREYSFNGQKQIVARTDEFRKPRLWQLRLVINEKEAAVVKDLFRDFHGQDTSLRQLAKELSQKSIPNPSGRHCVWTKECVRRILTNRAYTGKGHIGYGRKSSKEAFNRAKETEVEGCCPQLVTPEVFEAVQEKLEERRGARRKPQPSRASALSGALICGHCGYRLEKKSRIEKVKPTKKGDPAQSEVLKRRVYFACASAVHRPTLGCHQWRVYEDELLPLVTAKLVEEVDLELLHAINAQPKQPDQREQVERQKAELEKLQSAYKKARARYLKAPDFLLQDLEKDLEKMRQQLDEAEKRAEALKFAEHEDSASAFREWWNTVRPRLVKVAPLEWGKQQTEQQPILLSESQRKALEKYLHGRAGRCRAQLLDNGKVVFGEGDRVLELDANGETWQWVAVEFPVRSQILSEPEILRELLHKLGVTVKLYWKPKGKRFFELDRARLKAELNENVVAGRSKTNYRSFSWMRFSISSARHLLSERLNSKRKRRTKRWSIPVKTMAQAAKPT